MKKAQANEEEKADKLLKACELNETAKNLFNENFTLNNCVLSRLKLIEICLEDHLEPLEKIMESVALITKNNLCTTKEQKKVLATLQTNLRYNPFLTKNYQLSRDFYKEAINNKNLDEKSLPDTYINLSFALWKVYEQTHTTKKPDEKKKDLEEILELLRQVPLKKLSEQETKKTAVETLSFLQNKIEAAFVW
jgi:nitroreductase